MSGNLPTTMVEKVAAAEVADARSPMDQRRLVLRLLAAAIFLQNLVWLVVLRSSGTDWPSVPAVIAMAMTFTQAGLAAIVLSLGTSALLRRSLAVVPLVVFAAVVAARATTNDLKIWLGLLIANTVIVAVPLAVARLAGVHLARSEDSPGIAHSRQFTIFGVLTLTTLVAVALGICRLLNFPWNEIGGFVLFAAALATIPWFCGTVALALDRWQPVAVCSGIVSPLAGVVICLTSFSPANDEVAMIAMSTLHGAMTIAVCAVVRVAGYRLVWPNMEERSSG